MADRSTIEKQIDDALAGGPGYELETMFPNLIDFFLTGAMARKGLIAAGGSAKAAS